MKDTIEKKKIYLKLLQSNLWFFGIFFFLLWTEIQSYSNGWFSIWVVIFILLIPIYTIIYGIQSYKHTKNLFYPNLILWFFFALTAFLHMLLSFKSYDLLRLFRFSLPLFFISLFLTSFSFISSLITKLKIDKKEKASERQEDLPDITDK